MLSVVIITYNEASNIEACVQAASKVAQEVLVVDSKSTDQTTTLAQNAGAKVLTTEWQGYAQTKNFANQQARCDWILSIDADEILSAELIESIRTLNLDDDKVYALDRLTNYCGQWIKHSGWYPEWKVRLFNRKTSEWEGLYVHEKLKHKTKPETVRLKGKLFHYSYKSSEDHLQRIRKYARLSAMEMQAQGKRGNFVKRWIAPGFRFLKTLILKKAFLDGKNGWLISKRNALLVHLKYKILDQLNQKR